MTMKRSVRLFHAVGITPHTTTYSVSTHLHAFPATLTYSWINPYSSSHMFDVFTVDKVVHIDCFLLMQDRSCAMECPNWEDVVTYVENGGDFANCYLWYLFHGILQEYLQWILAMLWCSVDCMIPSTLFTRVMCCNSSVDKGTLPSCLWGTDQTMPRWLRPSQSSGFLFESFLLVLLPYSESVIVETFKPVDWMSYPDDYSWCTRRDIPLTIRGHLTPVVLFCFCFILQRVCHQGRFIQPFGADVAISPESIIVLEWSLGNLVDLATKIAVRDVC